LDVGVGREWRVPVGQCVVPDHKRNNEEDRDNPGSRREKEALKPTERPVTKRQPSVGNPLTAASPHAPQGSHALIISRSNRGFSCADEGAGAAASTAGSRGVAPAEAASPALVTRHSRAEPGPPTVYSGRTSAVAATASESSRHPRYRS